MISMSEQKRKQFLTVVGTLFLLTLLALAIFISAWTLPMGRVQAAEPSGAAWVLYVDGADETAVAPNTSFGNMAQPFDSLRLYVSYDFWHMQEDSS